MPKDRIITAGVLNVRLHPNDSAIYLDFIESIFRLKKPIKIRGRRHAMISLIDKSKSKDGYVTGVITSLLDLSFDGGWFDANQAKEADDETISKIFIPEGIYADSFQFYFLFDLINHRITVQTQSGSNNFSIHSALLLFDKLGDNLSITKKFGDAKINISKSSGAFETSFRKFVQVRKLNFELYRLNHSILDSNFEERVGGFMEANRLKRLDIEMSADSGESIPLSDDIETLASASEEQGKFSIRGRTVDGVRTISSEQSPRVLQARYDPEGQTELSALARLAGYQ